MELGKIIFESKTLKGKHLVTRYPQESDLKNLLDYINALSKERTFVRFQGEEITQDEEKKYLDSMLKKIQENKEVHLLVFSGNQLIGSAGIELKDLSEKYQGHFGISIANKWRGQGIGKLLMEKVIKEAKQNLPGLKLITLTVNANNKIAIKIYRQFGFKKFGLLPNGVTYRGQFNDQIYMYKSVQ